MDIYGGMHSSNVKQIARSRGSSNYHGSLSTCQAGVTWWPAHCEAWQ